ncbi:EF-P 5-aminopentanol modification-associated protein YfmH [Caldalkalibacillus mannanilyticus]|uniref:EF-P 5-aminopentanol modification-associated protein YfmH n=1 Tax=Caldalkalibacillus mannanilyticus TaxID=1418 RepID=UPI0004690367|nr:pitrilysin family protein [Caldalkalibacillus mannanilyticus]
MQILEFQQLKEKIYYEKLSNGLDVYVLPKQGFHKTYATFTTKYGSIDNHFIPPGAEENKVPDGIAHFLEHKMFEEETGDVFHEFSKYGAQVNAFTSFDRTAYLFTTTDHVHKNLITLLDFVQRPYFTDENVEKEKGIIEQEIKMYDDNPDWRAYFGFISALFHRHPVKIDIAGTVESIYQITKEMLYTCYHTFYHPSNMLLFVVGAVEPEKIFELVRENQSKKEYHDLPEIKRLFEEEPSTVAEPKKELSLSVGVPKCMMGYKEISLGLEGAEMMKQELATSLLLDMLVGPSSSFYQSLLEEGLIDDSFGADYNLEKSYGFSIIGGNTKNPELLSERVQTYIAEIQRTGLNRDDFERSRKKKIGSFLKYLNSPEYIANQFTRYQFNQLNLFEVLPTLERLTFEEVEQRLQGHFKKEQFAICIVR